MSVFCVSWQNPGPWLRLVITIVIYVGAFRFAPSAATPLALGGTLGSLLTAERARPLPGTGTPGCSQ
jgi:hypothetical protein